MTATNLIDELKPGDFIRVAFGRGSQVACVAKRTAQGNIHAWKLSARAGAGGRWKGPLRIWPGEVMNRLSPQEIAKLPKVPA